jgi:hypothetical protein
MERRNDRSHFSAANGPGHRRKRVINQPLDTRYVADPYERRALELIGGLDQQLRAEEARVRRHWAAQVEGLTGGEPGE